MATHWSQLDQDTVLFHRYQPCIVFCTLHAQPYDFESCLCAPADSHAGDRQVLFFFTTPLAMLGMFQQWEEGARILGEIETWVASTWLGPFVGPFVAGYLPSLIMLGLTALLPHIIYCTPMLATRAKHAHKCVCMWQ